MSTVYVLMEDTWDANEPAFLGRVVRSAVTWAGVGYADVIKHARHSLDCLARQAGVPDPPGWDKRIMMRLRLQQLTSGVSVGCVAIAPVDEHSVGAPGALVWGPFGEDEVSPRLPETDALASALNILGAP